MSVVVPFPKQPRPVPPPPPPRGRVFVWPCPDHGGSWAVILENKTGDEMSQLSSWFCFDDAERAAREAAARLNAKLLDGLDENGGPAA
jgi:hypothetical protein